MSDVQVFVDRGTGLEDLSRTTVSVNIRRGRTDETEPFQAGRANITLRNIGGEYDPEGDGFQLRDDVDIYVGGGVYGSWSEQVGTWAELDPTLIWLGPQVFSGFVEDVQLAYDVSGDSVVNLSCVDGLAILANQTLVQEAVSQQSSGQRVSAILNNAGVAWPSATSIDTGVSELAAGTATGNALEYARVIEESEQGYFYVARDGTLTFRSRDTVLQQPLGTEVFSDDGTGIAYEQIQRFSGARALFNRVLGELEDGTSRTADNAASQAQFSIRTLDLGTVLLLTGDVLQDLVDYVLFRFRTPSTRVDTITVALDRLTDLQVAEVGAIDLADAVDVTFTPPGRTAFTDELLVQGISHSVTVGGLWRTTLSFEQRDTRAFLILDDLNAGILDQNVLGF